MFAAQREMSDVCSTDATPAENNAPSSSTMAGTSKKTKCKGGVAANDAMKQYVDMKVRRTENRLLRAIAESEARVSTLITKSIGKALKKQTGEAQQKRISSTAPREDICVDSDTVIGDVLGELNGSTLNDPRSTNMHTWHSVLVS